MSRQASASDSSVYSDDSDPPPLVQPGRFSTSDRDSQSPTPDSRSAGHGAASPLTPDSGPIMLGLGLTKGDLLGSGSGADDYVSHRPAAPVQGPSYINYQPGLHSIAGPPPKPSRSPRLAASTAPAAAAPPPPRPPRLRSPSPPARSRSNLNMRSPPKTPPTSNTPSPIPAEDAVPLDAHQPDDSDFVFVSHSPDAMPAPLPHDGPAGGDPLGTVRSLHAREGAFPPSAFIHPRGHAPARQPLTGATFDNADDVSRVLDDRDSGSSPARSRPASPPAPPPSAFVHPLQRDKSLPRIVRDQSESPDASPAGDRTLRDIRRHSEISRSSSSQSRAGTVTSKHLSMDMRLRQTPSPAPSSNPRSSSSRSSRDELPEIPQHERLSAMPRTPSSLSMTSGLDHISTYDSTKTPTGKRRYKPGIFPPTMLFQDILKKKTALERSLAYAKRTVELMEDSSGLEEWVQAMKHRHKPAAAPNRSNVRVSIQPVRRPHAAPGGVQIRHVSQGSIASEATFPVRPDSYVAQDLTPHEDTDLSPPTGPPVLPFPGIVGTRQAAAVAKAGFSPSSSLRSIASSGSNKSAGGFFATLSRKASTAKKNGILPLSPQGRPAPRRAALPQPQPRHIDVDSVPRAVPGGPRMPGQRMVRSNTVGAEAMRNAALPPLRTAATQRSPFSPLSPYSALSPNDAFTRSLNGMVDVLPQANRDTLAQYLRRAKGQEIIAISAYLEDIKAGTVQNG
ncbi:hypothetical protein AURDEDRAFT_110517 [Auricularia subglabra TFB-10046 SS5]|nr:hypothetical protein AURDEDRAFT_110517 [Auricularia subglabra TFB-10046 SS5]